MSKTLDEIKAAMEKLNSQPARATGKINDVYLTRDILHLLPKLIAEVEAKDRFIDNVSEEGRKQVSYSWGDLVEDVEALEDELKALE